MKLILSRKGFDSSFGGMPSPILPDGTLLSFPIPDKSTAMRYDQLFYNGTSYLSLLQQLKPSFQENCCHLDPDIYSGLSNAPYWKPAFGQTGAARTHLLRQGVGVGDVFLFYGWYKKTEYANGQLRYIAKAPDLHVIYGYLQIGEVMSDDGEIQKFTWHPHASLPYAKKSSHTLFLPSKHFMESSLSGYGTFVYHDSLVLTKQGYSRSKWQLPSCLCGKPITYHDEKSQKLDYFQSAMKGQEFVCSVDAEILDWLKQTVFTGAGADMAVNRI